MHIWFDWLLVLIHRTLAASAFSTMAVCTTPRGHRRRAVVASKTLKLGSMPGRPRSSVSYLTWRMCKCVCQNAIILLLHSVLYILYMHFALSSLSLFLCYFCHRSAWKWLGQVRPHRWRPKSAQRSRHARFGQRLGDHCECLYLCMCVLVGVCVFLCALLLRPDKNNFYIGLAFGAGVI